jgi:hypothetical protein
MVRRGKAGEVRYGRVWRGTVGYGKVWRGR